MLIKNQQYTSLRQATYFKGIDSALYLTFLINPNTPGSAKAYSTKEKKMIELEKQIKSYNPTLERTKYIR